MERVVEVAVLTDLVAVERVASRCEGVKFCRAPVSFGGFAGGESARSWRRCCSWACSVTWHCMGGASR